MADCYELSDISPSIKDAIERLCNLKGEARHKDIVEELLKDAEASSVIDRAIQRCPIYSPGGMAGIMLAKFNQLDTTADLGDFSRRFIRQKHEPRPYPWRRAE